MGSLGIKHLLIASLCVALCSCVTEDRNGCPQGQYWTKYECLPCDRCDSYDGHVLLSRCTETENTLCQSCLEFKTGMRCLSQYTANQDTWVVRREQALENRGGRPTHPCFVIEPSVLDRMARMTPSEADRHKYTCATSQSQMTPPSPQSTTESWSSLESEGRAHLDIGDNDRADSGRTYSGRAGSRRKYAGKGGSRRKSAGRGKIANRFPWSETIDKDKEEQIVPSVSSSNGVSRPGNFPTISRNSPTSGPVLKNTENSWDKGNNIFTSGNNRNDGNREYGAEGKEPDSDDSSSSSWFLNHEELLYSLMAAIVVVVTLSIFIVSRLRSSGKLGFNRMAPKKINVNAPGDPTDPQLESLEMGNMEGTLSEGIPATTLGKTSSNLEMSGKPMDDSWVAALKSTASLSSMDWLAKTSNISSHNDFGSYHSEAETQTDQETVSHNSTTVFGTKWQFIGSFSRDGGVLQRANSDVSLVVGRDAVSSGHFVTISGAIFTDGSEIRSKFSIGSNEMLITPLVEYHAKDSYHFQNHVTVKLPHALPDDFDASYIKFYTFSVDDCGNIDLKSLPMKSKDSNSLDDEDAYWEISNQGRMFIAKTKHFSGYFCTTCESKSKLPSVYARVFGSHIQIKASRREVRLILYLWDHRLNIKDFIEAIRQQECDMDRQLLSDEPVPLLQNASSDSSIVMRMETLGDPEDQKLWQHIMRSNARRPLFKPLQVRKLHQIVLCCQQNNPMRIEWAMENVPSETFPSNVFQCLIEMVHVPEGVTNYEEALLDAEEENIRTFYVRNLKMAQPARVTSDDIRLRQELLKKAMTHILNRRDMEEICQAFGMNKKDIGNLSKKFDSDNALKTGLLDECSKTCGMVHFVQTLPEVLEKAQLYHVIEYLQDRDLLSTLSSYKQHKCGSMDSFPMHQSPVYLRQLSESTVCKSISHPQIELESRQRQSNSNSSPSNDSSKSSSSSHLNGCGAGHNWLRLQIHPNDQSVSTERKEDGVQVSPDSDYNSPPSTPPKYCMRNYHNHPSNGPTVNISPVMSDLNMSTTNNSYHDNCNNSRDINKINSMPKTALTTSYNNSNNIDNDKSNERFSSSQNSSSIYSESNNYSLSDDSDFDDSCLAVIDSRDIVDRSKETSQTEWSIQSENTSRKELALSRGQQPPLVTGAAYPEIPEEQQIFHRGQHPASKAANSPGDIQHNKRHSEEMVSPRPSKVQQSEDDLGDTYVKETYI